MASRSINRNMFILRGLQCGIGVLRSLRYVLAAGLFSVAAFGACTFTLSPSPQVYTDSLGYIDAANHPLIIQITASAQSCPWTADASDGFAAVSSAISGTGNGSVTYSVAANTSGIARSVTLNIAGNALTLTQDATPTTFADVLPNQFTEPFFDGMSGLRTNNITKGCLAVPLNYCPNDNVTRDQMAVFIVRTILGGGPNVDNFSYSTTPYFTDVPPTYQYFKWIQKMRDLGVTSGTTATTYGPQLPVTRDQMAIFIVRARLGSNTAFSPPTVQQFTDVAPTGPEQSYYPYIQELKAIGITSGCTLTTYCPQGAVTRGQMAVFLMRAGFNTLLGAGSPLLTQLSPTTGPPGTPPFTLTVKGINTHFAQGTTTILSPSGVTFGTPTVTDATDLTVTMTIPASTPLGQISITAQTQTSAGVFEVASAPNVFTVGTGDPAPMITSFTPASGPIGTSVTITGTTLVSSTGLPAQVLVPLATGGVIAAPVNQTTATPTSLSFVFPSNGTSGNIQVLSFSGSATSTTAFTVVPSSTYSVVTSPSIGNVIAGQSTTYTVSLASSSGFSGLAALSLSGLPSGLTATFSPTQISVGQQSTLTITAPSNQGTNTATITITAAATVEGIAESIGSTATLNVTPITTSFLGRTVVDDTTNTSLAGVTVYMVGLDGSGHTTACTGSTVSDGSGNFSLTNLPAACLGPQLIGFVGDSVTAPAGRYAGLQLIFTLVSNTVVVSPILVHLPRVDNVETFNVIQNDTVDQSYTFTSIPGLSVTVYAGTVFTKQDGTQPNPFPLAAIDVPVDRLPDPVPPTTAGVAAFIVAFQPAETNATKPVAVAFPNTLNTPPGTDVPLMTLDPTLGRSVPYGTGTVSNDGSTIIPDINPSLIPMRYGIIHFDWHGPLGGPPNGNNPNGGCCNPSNGNPGGPNGGPNGGGPNGGGPDGGGPNGGGPDGGGPDGPDGGGPNGGPPNGGDPIDYSTGINVLTTTDIAIQGNLGDVAVTRTYRSAAAQGAIPGPFGWGTSDNYDYRLDTLTPQSSSIINVILPNGARIPFNLQADGTLINTTNPTVAGWVMTTTANGTTTLRQKTGMYYQFIPGIPPTGSVLTAIGDPNGNVTKIVRASPYQITEIDDPAGRKLVFTYSGYTVSQITDPIGRAVSYTYNNAGYLDTFTNVLGGVTKYQYDSNGNLTKTTDPRGVVVSTTYDTNQRVTSQTLPSGGTMHFAYTLVNALIPTSPLSQTVVTDTLGNSTTYRFNTNGYVVGVTDANGQTRLINRQSGTNLILSMTGTGVCPFCGDTRSGDVTYTYDAIGNRLSETDGLGNTIHYTYDPVFNHLTAVADKNGNARQFTYDSHSNLISMTDKRGNTTTFTHSTTGLLTSSTDEAGKTTTYTYDAVGNAIKVTDPTGSATQFAFDGISRQVAQMDALGGSSSVTYNALNEQNQVTEANGRTTKFTYDAAGYVKSYTDPNGGTVQYGYDSAGRRNSRTDQMGHVTNYGFDTMSNMVTFANGRGQAATYSYDALNRVTKEVYVDATVTRGYDANGRLKQVVDSVGGTFTYAWDAVGNMLQQVGPFGVVTYTRDANGRVLTRQVTGDPKVTYTYDANGNLTSASMAGANIQQSFDLRNHLSAETRNNGVNGSYTYDAAGRLMSIAEVNGSTSLVSRNYSYDPIGRLLSQTGEGGLALQTPAATSTFDADNQITSGGPLASTFTNDADGNRLTDASPAGTTTYTWDARGRLQAISAAGVVTDFLYDYAGNLIQKLTVKTGGSTVEHYVLDDLTNVVRQDKVGAGTVALLTGRRVDETFALVTGGTAVFPLTDIETSTVALTNSAGTITGSVYYEPFGKTTESGATSLLEFTSRQQASPDLYYLRSRWLDARNGRFISQDPWGLAGGDPDTYRYVANDPLNHIDPSGLWTFQIGGAINVQLGFINIQGFAGFAVDGHGGVGFYYGGGGGGGVGADVGGGLQLAGSNGDTIKDLGGPFGNASASVGAGGHVSVDGFAGQGTHGQPVVGGGVTIGLGGGADVVVGATNTGVVRLH